MNADNLPHFKNPKGDNQELLNLQYAHYHGDKSALVQMYYKMRKIAEAFFEDIYKKAKPEFVASFDVGLKAQKCHDSATQVLERYLKSPSFYVRDSLTAYLYLTVRSQMYGVESGTKRKSKYELEGLVFFTDEPRKLETEQEEREEVKIIAWELATGKKWECSTLDELRKIKRNGAKVFATLDDNTLAELVRTGNAWNGWTFDIIED